MLSLLVLSTLLLVFLVLPAWTVAYAARRAGSPRGKFRVGLLAMVLVGLINLACIALGSFVKPEGEISDAAFALALLAVNVLAAFVVLKRVFHLSVRRTLVPFGALFLVNVVLAAAHYGLVRPSVCEAFQTPSISMAPTIEKGDRFSVNKRATPRRWDVVTYRTERERGGVVLYLKRVVGLPGERIRFEGGSLYVNDQRVGAPSVLEGKLRMRLPGIGAAHMGRYQDGEDVTLGPDEYFLVGDNIDQSADSRIDGPTPASALLGVVDLMYWPPRKMAVWR